jgi:uncharacterized protein (TIGR02266 family)
MRDHDDDELARLEAEAVAAEEALEAELAEAQSDQAEVQSALRELRLRLEEEQSRGATGIDAMLQNLRHLEAPGVPLEAHRARVAETRLDALRARNWVVTALREDLRRFTFELGECVKLADTARATLTKLAEQPRINVRPRLERIRAVTTDLSARGVQNEPSNAPRRKRPRIRMETEIDLQSASNLFTGYSENISQGGLFIATDDTFELGTEVDLAFTLPGGVDVRARGEVKWHREESDDVTAGVGISFTQISDAARAAVERFLELREPIYHEESEA